MPLGVPDWHYCLLKLLLKWFYHFNLAVSPLVLCLTAVGKVSLLCSGKSVEFQYFCHSARGQQKAEVSRVQTMSADLYWQRLASLPSLSTALMGFRSITMSRQREAQSQSFWNPNKERCILIRADAHVGLLAASASCALPIKPLAVIYSLTRIEEISPEEVQHILAAWAERLF